MRLVRVAVIAAVSGTVAMSACSGRGVPDTLVPESAEMAIRETAPDRPLRVIFSWRVLDGDARFAGRGAARIEPPYHARLDLFGPNGEGYVSAAVVGTDIRLPGAGAELLPPPAMIWSVLGVVLPPEHAVLQGTRETAGDVELHYGVDGSRLRYGLEDGRLRSVDWRGDGRRTVVQLTGSSDGLPARAVYRDWSRNTELRIELETVEEVEPYPPEIWSPGH